MVQIHISGRQPKLAYFVVDITDREVPSTSIYLHSKSDKGPEGSEAIHDGASIYQIEATQNYPGLYKFRTRILAPARPIMCACRPIIPHISYAPYAYPVPAYNNNPRQAVRTGMDFLINMGDSWLSNTPSPWRNCSAYDDESRRHQTVHRLPSDRSSRHARLSDRRFARLRSHSAARARIYSRSHL